jgi:hypothetical protein
MNLIKKPLSMETRGLEGGTQAAQYWYSPDRKINAALCHAGGCLSEQYRMVIYLKKLSQ